MADDWEDWEAEEFKPPVPAAPAAAKSQPSAEFETAGAAILAKVSELDMSKFQDEDQEEEAKPEWMTKTAPKPAAKPAKKAALVDAPLADPAAERARQQRLVEESDFAAARELFGGEGGDRLESFLPKSVKDMEDFAGQLFARYLQPHAANKHYKALVKALLRAACGPLPSTEVKDVETCVSGVKAERLKAEKEAEKARSSRGKGSLNMGKGGSAGLDDYIYETTGGMDDDYDFM